MKKVIFICFLLFGCASVSPEVNYVKALTASCQAYTSLLNTLAVYNRANLLSDSQVITIDSVIAVVAPICESKKILNPQEALKKIEVFIETLVIMKGKIHGSGNRTIARS